MMSPEVIKLFDVLKEYKQSLMNRRSSCIQKIAAAVDAEDETQFNAVLSILVGLNNDINHVGNLINRIFDLIVEIEDTCEKYSDSEEKQC